MTSLKTLNNTLAMSSPGKTLTVKTTAKSLKTKLQSSKAYVLILEVFTMQSQ